jgi:hypothetical protein
MAIDITGANVYFGECVHVNSSSWTTITETRRIAAIAQARRDIEQFIGDTSLDETTTDNEDFPRHDAAVYEQALFLLQKQDRLAVIDGLIKNYATTDRRGFMSDIAPNKGTISPEVIKYLVTSPRAIRLVRG